MTAATGHRVVSLDEVPGSPHTMKGVYEGVKFTNVGLEPASV
jgi:hypothetical protein